MRCSSCHSEIPDNVEFCPVCGAKAITVPTAETKAADSHATNALIFGVLCLVFNGILGFIFSIIAIVNGNAYKKDYGITEGNAKAGKVFGIIGLIKSILVALLVIVYIVILVAILAASGEIFEEISEGFRAGFEQGMMY